METFQSLSRGGARRSIFLAITMLVLSVLSCDLAGQVSTPPTPSMVAVVPTVAPTLTAIVAPTLAATAAPTRLGGGAGRIAFVTTRDGNAAIYVTNADGSQPINLTSSPGNLSQPAWSPDGAHIAFVSDRDGRNEIYVMNANGGYPTRLTNYPAGSSYPAWSPDGTRIAFDSPRDGNWEIYVMNADGSQVIRLTNNPADDGNPDWSPDGKRIAFQSTRDGVSEIYVMNADGSQPVRLTNTSKNQYYPKWSPDGTRIAFASFRDGNWEIYVMNADGSQQTRLTRTTARDLFPAWSADGTQIYFASERDGNFQIYTMKPDGSQQIRISSNAAVETWPDWQPRETSAEALMTPPSSVNALATLWLPTATLRPPTGTVTRTVTVMATVSSAATVTPTVTVMATGSPTAAVAAPPPIVLPPCPPASAMPSGMLFCDDFASKAISDSNGWDFYTSQYEDVTWSPNRFTVAIKEKGWWDIEAPNGEYDNFGAEIEAQPLSDDYAKYGLVFRGSGDEHALSYYSVGITSDGGYFMDKMIAGKWSDVPPVKWTPTPLVRQGKNKNLIGVIAQGNTFALYINRVSVNTITDDSLAGKGHVAFLAATGTDNANAVVAFSRLTILTPDKAKAEWSSVAPAPSPASQPTTAPVQPSAPPGLYVTGLRTDPPALGASMDAGFYVTFLNTTNGEQQYRWNVYVFRADSPKNSFGEASAQLTTIPVGSVEQKAQGSWRIGVGTCGSYFARVAWLDEAKNRTYFAKPDGQVYELWFTVCQ